MGIHLLAPQRARLQQGTVWAGSQLQPRQGAGCSGAYGAEGGSGREWCSERGGAGEVIGRGGRGCVCTGGGPRWGWHSRSQAIVGGTWGGGGGGKGWGREGAKVGAGEVTRRGLWGCMCTTGAGGWHTVAAKALLEALWGGAGGGARKGWGREGAKGGKQGRWCGVASGGCMRTLGTWGCMRTLGTWGWRRPNVGDTCGPAGVNRGKPW